MTTPMQGEAMKHPEQPMKHPETAALAREAFEASKCKTHDDFVTMMQGGVALRTLRRWLAGDGPASDLGTMVLQQVKAGWKPKKLRPDA